MSNECFVIQPISDTKFTKRYEDIYRPAIEAAGLTAYRVDLDPSVKIPIEEIEAKIRNVKICFAEISIDNPNVWYELGYAFASNKDVVMVCDESRRDFPFDVRHKNIISYKSESPSDFNDLRVKIVEKINAYLKTQKTAEKILESPIKETDGLQPYELSLLAFIISQQYTDEENVSIYDLRNSMTKAGFNEVAVSIGIRLLRNKNLIDTKTVSDFNGNEYSICKLTDHGVNFILSNTHLFDLQQSQQRPTSSRIIADDLPF